MPANWTQKPRPLWHAIAMKWGTVWLDYLASVIFKTTSPYQFLSTEKLNVSWFRLPAAIVSENP
jgi:hypothetical protein